MNPLYEMLLGAGLMVGGTIAGYFLRGKIQGKPPADRDAWAEAKKKGQEQQKERGFEIGDGK